MNQNKKLISYLAPVFLIGALIAGVLLVFQRQNINKEAAPATTLSVNPTDQDKFVGDTFTINVMLETGANQVVGFDSDLRFDASAFEIVEMKAGEASEGYTIVKNEIDNDNGTALYSVFNLDKTQFLSGSDLKIVSLTAKVKDNVNKEKYEFSFDSSSAVAALLENSNALALTKSGHVTVKENVSETPSPAPVKGEPNSCNGTCGSHSNCKAGLFCYEGFCRNPECSYDVSCGCTSPTATPRPTVRPANQGGTTTAVKTKSPSPKPTPTPIDEIVYYDLGNFGGSQTVAPRPTVQVFATGNPVDIGQDQTKKPLSAKSIAVTILAALALIYGTFLLIKTIRHPQSN